MVDADVTRLAWGAQALWHSLEPVLPGIAVEVLPSCESTNSALVERTRVGAGSRPGVGARRGDTPSVPQAESPALGRRAMDTQPCLLVAEQQTRGRGRMGRTWQSTVGASLTFSLALPLAPADWSGLSLAVGVALAEALDPADSGAAPQLLLKWPNDLWLRDPAAPLGGRKLGGILIETVPVGGRRMGVIGVGLNVLPQEFDELSSGYGCVRELDPLATAPGTLARVAPALVRALLQFEQAGFAAFASRFERRDALAGRRVSTNLHEAPDGVAEGVDEHGALRLVCPDGRRVAISSGEVSIRPTPGPVP